MLDLRREPKSMTCRHEKSDPAIKHKICAADERGRRPTEKPGKPRAMENAERGGMLRAPSQGGASDRVRQAARLKKKGTIHRAPAHTPTPSGCALVNFALRREAELPVHNGAYRAQQDRRRPIPSQERRAHDGLRI
jgi:hypothetical protein